MRLSRHRTLQLAATIATGAALVLGATTGASADPVDPEKDPTSTDSSPVFTLQALEAVKLNQVDNQTPSNVVTAESLSSGENGLNYTAVSNASEQSAVLDASLLDEDILVASGETFVDLSWRADPDIREYLVYRGDDLVGKTSSTGFGMTVSPLGA